MVENVKSLGEEALSMGSTTRKLQESSSLHDATSSSGGFMLGKHVEGDLGDPANSYVDSLREPKDTRSPGNRLPPLDTTSPQSGDSLSPTSRQRNHQATSATDSPEPKSTASAPRDREAASPVKEEHQVGQSGPESHSIRDPAFHDNMGGSSSGGGPPHDGGPPHAESHGSPPGSPRRGGIGDDVEDGKDLPLLRKANERKGFLGALIRFWRWLTRDRTGRTVRGPKLPLKQHLQEPMKGVWDSKSTFKYSPRPPTDNQDRDMTTLTILGKRLKENRELAKKTWIEDLRKAGAVDFRVQILSTDKFLDLAEKLGEQSRIAANYAKKIEPLGKELATAFGGEPWLKEVFKHMIESYKKAYHGLPGLKLDPHFYGTPLSPLLLLAEEDNKASSAVQAEKLSQAKSDGNSAKKAEDTARATQKSNVYVQPFSSVLAEQGKLKGYFDHTTSSKIETLQVAARKYHQYVAHFKATAETQEEITHYLEEALSLKIIHTKYDEAIFKYFDNLDRDSEKQRYFLTDLTREDLSDEEKQQKIIKALDLKEEPTINTHEKNTEKDQSEL